MNEDNNIEQNQFENSKYQWTMQTTKFLIENVRNHVVSLNNKNCMHKTIWRRIANNFKEKDYNVTEEQCYTKWENLKRRYKNVRDSNNQTGKNRESWEYFDMIDEFINKQPEIAPVSIASSTHGFRIRQSSPELIAESNNENDSAAINTSYNARRNIRKRRKNEPEWVKIYKQKEVHHKENIKMQKRFLKIFKIYLQKDNVQ
ncbi:uncharacterized protein LOC116843389 [Odontomachus brunneus]|uniref:uncharacterized protein LOC116843389 n=1 Tax=Odontomachus brunneus TaxID=486640 RepID=UPI0013F1F5B3|nr:uncharacterized protein LOC116843389 [Odontomachus brunneus]